ncbi:MAG TPA: GTPase ObgE [Candidatus Limnocylindria bacterium]|nr:GTPase ObgE [Candidatus Limnocylindria bacterium]
MFVDRARIHVRAGAGGDGAASFRREAHVPRGGPDGGDGGRGGDVVLVAEAGMTTLSELHRHPHHRAEPGGRGAGKRAHGRDGRDTVLRVPPGTVVRRADGEWLGELLRPGDRLRVAVGGRGGRGNAHFATPTHRAPQHHEKGEPGEEGWLQLELKLIADAGLVGAPNAGKSSLLAALTAATPRIGAYPFTTVAPNLGVLDLDGDVTAVIADVPGLIEGAHAGHGLGHEFLRHVERTRVLIGVIDGADDDPLGAWDAVVDELRLHDPALVERPTRLVVTKLDLPDVRAAWPALRARLRERGQDAIGVSAHDGTGLDDLRAAVRDALAEADRREATMGAAAPGVRVHRFDPLDAGWQVVAEPDGLRIRGRRIEATAARTDFENPESLERFQRQLERMGIEEELRRMGARNGTTVRIGPAELEWTDDE